MPNSSSYIAKTPDSRGYVDYSEQENSTWALLYQRQMKLLDGRACQGFIDGLETLKFSAERIPQLPEVNRVLQRETGWQVAPVAALIPFQRFFELLANKQFPAATFIRRHEELDYLQEPDIFHELFGHCPLLTDPSYAEFSQAYGKLGLNASPQQRVYLARLYWFTIEFGLVESSEGLRIYGGGILSSSEEVDYSLNSELPLRQPLDVLTALRTPYRIDELQKSYFVIDDLSELHRLSELDLMSYVSRAQDMGLLPSRHTKAA